MRRLIHEDRLVGLEQSVSIFFPGRQRPAVWRDTRKGTFQSLRNSSIHTIPMRRTWTYLVWVHCSNW